MQQLNTTLLAMARRTVGMQKAAFQPPPGGDPAAAGQPAPSPVAGPPGGPPTGPGAPPGGLPPGGAAPTDPLAAMGPGAPPPGPMTPQPSVAPAGQVDPNTGQPKKPKLDPAMLDQRMYMLQMQITALLNHFDIKMPPEAVVPPPAGAPQPTPEQAMQGQGSPADLVTAGGAQGGAAGGQPGADNSAISPIQPMDAAATAAMVPGGQAKTAAPRTLDDILAEPVRAASYIGDPVARRHPTTDGAAALAERFRSLAVGGVPSATVPWGR